MDPSTKFHIFNFFPLPPVPQPSPRTVAFSNDKETHKSHPTPSKTHPTTLQIYIPNHKPSLYNSSIQTYPKLATPSQPQPPENPNKTPQNPAQVSELTTHLTPIPPSPPPIPNVTRRFSSQRTLNPNLKFPQRSNIRT